VLQLLAVCCIELHYVAYMCVSTGSTSPHSHVLQCFAVYLMHLTRVAIGYTYCNMLYVAVYCGVLQCVAVYCSVLQCVAVCCSVLQCVAVFCSL